MNFHIEGRNPKKDIQKTYLWQLWIPELPKFFSKFPTLAHDDVIFACKNAAIPGMSIENIETYFLGVKQLFPCKTIFDNSVELTFEEREDQKVLLTFSEWIKKIHNPTPVSIFGGGGSHLRKKDIAKDMFLKLYSNDGNELKYNIKFENAYPSKLGEVTLDYTDNNSVKFPITISFDYWSLI